jgi:UPF0755 protein
MTSHTSLLPSALIGVLMAVFLGGAVWVIAGSPGSVGETGVVLPAKASQDPVYIAVQKGDDAGTIGRRLQASGIIASGEAFERLAKITGVERRLAAGEYEFTAATSVLDALGRIRDGLTASRIVAVPEGMRLEEVATLLEKRGVVKASEFLAAANALAASGTSIDSDLLQSRPSASTLEGYVYPATYGFNRTISANEALLQMLKAMSERFTPQLREEARAQGLTVHQVLTLASIVEREVVLPEERPLIAAVYRNRLRIDMPLQADPTVQYAIAARPGNVVEFGFWKKVLSAQDLLFDSNYNTYAKRGLPPGPIASPGIDSILAVIRPAKTNNLFFVARNDGTHAFSDTYEEHQRNVQRFQP